MIVMICHQKLSAHISVIQLCLLFFHILYMENMLKAPCCNWYLHGAVVALLLDNKKEKTIQEIHQEEI